MVASPGEEFARERKQRGDMTGFAQFLQAAKSQLRL